MAGFAIVIRPLGESLPDHALFEVAFQGFQEGAAIDVSFWEIHNRTKDKPDGDKRQMGVVSGKLRRHGGTRMSPLFGLVPDTPPAKNDFKDRPWVGFVLEPGGSDGDAHRFQLTHDVDERPEGEIWEVEVHITSPKVKSPPVPVAWPRYAVPWRGHERRATYDWHAGNEVKLYNDGSEDSEGKAGAFHDIVEEIGKAKHFIFVVDWSFHPLMLPRRPGSPKLEDTIGAHLVKRAAEGVVVAVHTWKHLDLSAVADDQNNFSGQILWWIAGKLGLADKIREKKTLFWRAGYRGVTVTHHQKFVAYDCDGGTDGRRRVGVFFGGLDLTKGRFDWPEHPILAFDPAKVDPRKPLEPNPNAKPFLTQLDFGGVAYKAEAEASGAQVEHGDDWYNAELQGSLHLVQQKDASGQALFHIFPRQPWHDIHAHMVGPTAWDFVREFIGRWNVTTWWAAPTPVLGVVGDVGDLGGDETPHVQDVLFKTLMDRKKFQQQWEPASGPFAAQMLRSIEPKHWHAPKKNPEWHPSREEFDFKLAGFERSIQESYIRALSRAERFVYIETQYFIGSGRLWDRPNQTGVANRLPETIVHRILQRAADRAPFHAYILLPMYPEGAPDTMQAVAIRRFEWRTMWYMIRAVEQGVKKIDPGLSWKQFLSFYCLSQWHRDDGTVETVRQTDTPRADLMNTNRRHMIYIHSKLMIVDDRYLIVGSANLNERSLAGDRDTEDCVAMWPSGPTHEEDCVKEIQRLRGRLWDEHLGGDKPGSWDKPWEKACVDAVQKAGLNNWKEMRTGKRSGTGHLVMLPFELGKEGIVFKATVSFPPMHGVVVPDGHENLPDPLHLHSKDWMWSAPGVHAMTAIDIAE